MVTLGWRARLLVLVGLVGLFLGDGESQSRITHLLAWEPAAPVSLFELEQCANRRGSCAFRLVATLPGVTWEWETGPVRRNAPLCWRVRATDPPVVYSWSNIVCV